MNLVGTARLAVSIAVISGMFALGCSKPATPDTSSSSNNTNSSASATGSGPPSPSTFASGSTPTAGPESNPPAVIHGGTTIVITVDQTLNSKNNNSGDHFDASLAVPIRVNGRDLIPSGARAIGVVTDAKSAGRFKGNAEISLTLASITFNGQHYPVKTSIVTQAGKGRGKRTAVGAGGGAAVGAIIGALAGHGKGAVIGAGAGAGAGTAGAAFTGDRDIEIPAETKLSFKLTRPVEISEK